MAKAKLKFLDLNDRHPGVSPGVAAAYAEAARVSFGRGDTHVPVRKRNFFIPLGADRARRRAR